MQSCGSQVLAQQSAVPAGPRKAEPGVRPRAGSVLEEALPPVRLMDQDGKLRTVPGISLEEIQRLLAEKDQDSGRTVLPRYTLQRLQATGSVVRQNAQITFEFSIVTHGDDWVRVPLRLFEAAIREDASYEGDGDHFLDFEVEEGGYVIWIRGAASGVHTVTLKAVVPVVQGLGGARLKLTAPRATRSEMKLVVPVANLIGKVTGGATLDEPRAVVSPSATELGARNLDGSFELAWRQAGQAEEESATNLEAIGAIAARIDGRSIRFTAHLTVRSLGGDFKSFRVQLPPDARLIETDQSDYALTDVPPGPGMDEPHQVEVEFDQRTPGPVECRIVAEQPWHAARSDEAMNLSGFNVLGAVRQWGHVGVYVVGEWQVHWGPPDSSVRRVETIPDTLRREDLHAGFEYARQPFSLAARIVPRETRTHVDPEYLFLVGSEQVRLEARLKYKVRGAKVFQLEVDLPGWEIEEIGPDHLINVDAVVTTQTTPLVIPLLQPSAGSFELLVRARRPAPEAGSPLDLALPAPRATTITPAAVVILPDDNIELRPRAELIGGMNRQRVPPPMKLPMRQQEALFYRGEIAQSRFAADVALRPLAIDVGLHSRVELTVASGRVKQHFSYVVAHEPLSSVSLQVPRRLLDANEVKFALDGRPLIPRLPPERDDKLAAIGVHLDLPAARIGSLEITASFPLAIRDVFPNTTTLYEVPLVMPDDGRLERNELEVETSAGMSVQVRGGSWKALAGPRPEAVETAPLRLSSATPEPKLALAVTLEDHPSSEKTIVEKAWIQSWFTPHGRTDRAAYRFTTHESQVELTLPAGASPTDVRVFLNGKTIPLDHPLEGILVVRLPHEQFGRRHLLEILYRFSDSRSGSGRLNLEAPTWSTPVWVQRFYWQLVLPAQQHLLIGPRDLAAEYRWRWRDFGFHREPSKDQSQLESWIGAQRRAALSPSANSYLFSALDGAVRLEGRTAPRSLLVFMFSLAALGVGLTLIYFPLARRQSVLLTFALALAALGVVFPDQAVLAAQASSAGIVLACLAKWLEWLVAGRRTPRSIARRGSSSILRQRVVELQVGPIAGAGPSSTMTAALEIPVGQSGSGR